MKSGLNNNKFQTQVKELVLFEEDLIKLIKNLRFRKVDNEFQRTLARDLNDIRSSRKTLTDKEAATNINKKPIKHAREASIIYRIEINSTSNSFITLKNHKENF